MSIILNIDTALNGASVSLAREGKTFSVSKNEEQKDHAAWLHPAIASILKQNGLHINQIDAIAVTIGPGSYTGLRVGLSAAKGLCYALQKPLITISTLKVMAFTVLAESTSLICSMIDARRMEVFTAVYDQELNESVPACAMVLDEESFMSLLNNEKILFCGTGSKKLQTFISSPNAAFSETNYQATDLAVLSNQDFCAGKFAELAYTEPLYIKEFYSPAPKTGN